MNSNQSCCNSSSKIITSDIWNHVKSQGERYAFETVQQDVTNGTKLSFNEISKNVELLGLVLRKSNLPSGVGLCSENNTDYCWILLGILNAGIRCTLLNPKYSAREMRHFLSLTKPDLIFCSKFVIEQVYHAGETFSSICSEFSCIKNIYVTGITINDENHGYESLSSLLKYEEFLSNRVIRGQEITEDDHVDTFDHGNREALILASSGSTGLPKGVVLTHKAIVAALKLSFVYARSRETALGLMPFFHAYGLILALMCLCEGSKLIIVPKLLGSKYLSDVISSHQINNVYVIPSLLATIGKCPSFTKEKLASVKHVWTSAGRVSKGIQERAVKIMPDKAVLHHCYGMTETSFVTMTGPYHEKPESPGKLVPNIECKIMRGDKLCGPEEVGELYFRGTPLLKGYLNNLEATRESLQEDGWLRSGDIGYRDKDGDFFIVDRIKEMIKYQGNQISPVEIEQIILELPEVLEAAVVGLPDEDFGELPAAGIVVKDDSNLTEKEVKEHVAKQVSTHKRLRGGVFILEEIPKTGSGKIQRKETLKQIMETIDLNRSSPQER